ncbi:unnamed protein product, partial [Closterium sp. Yama58-4]
MFQVRSHRWRAVCRPLGVFVTSAFLLLLLSLAWLPASRSQVLDSPVLWLTLSTLGKFRLPCVSHPYLRDCTCLVVYALLSPRRVLSVPYSDFPFPNAYIRSSLPLFRTFPLPSPLSHTPPLFLPHIPPPITLSPLPRLPMFPLPTSPPPNVPPFPHSRLSTFPPYPTPSLRKFSPHALPAASDEKDAHSAAAGESAGAGDGADAGYGEEPGTRDGGDAGDSESADSSSGESAIGESGSESDSSESGSGESSSSESERTSSGKLRGVFELPDPPSRFDARAAWHHMRYRTPDACWSQQERHLYHTADQSHPSQAFVDAVVMFEAMQRECVSQGGVEDWEWVRNRTDWEEGIPRYGPNSKPCRYIMIHDLSRGVGNRIASYVISFVLALLTNRAIITPPNGFLTRRFCNPFARGNTSWTIPPAVYDLLLASALPEPRLHLSEMAKRLNIGVARKRIPAVTAFLQRDVERNGSVWVDLHARVVNQFCDVIWETVDLAPFWFTSIDAYSLPSLYYIKSYAERLHELFPDRRVFTHVARFLLHPDNRLWAKITYTFLANLGHYPHRLGVQIRSPDGIDLPVADRILRCGVRAQYLPPTQPYPEDPSMATPTLGYPGSGAGGGGDAETYRSFHTMGVFVSSLSIRHMLDLETHYAQHLTIGNTFVSFWSLTNEGRETRDEQQLIDAVMDMWILSFSDRLLITHISSFGRTAVGLAGIEAYSMAITVIKMRGVDWRKSTGPVCERVSSEPCDTVGMPVKY